MANLNDLIKTAKEQTAKEQLKTLRINVPLLLHRLRLLVRETQTLPRRSIRLPNHLLTRYRPCRMRTH